jgi:hypothetical protein
MTDNTDIKDIYSKIDAMPAQRLVKKDAFLGEASLEKEENSAFSNFSKSFSGKEDKRKIPPVIVLFVLSVFFAGIIIWFVYDFIQNTNTYQSSQKIR